MTPLTHHDIVRHAAPLVRGGLRVDLAASSRAERRILFQPRTVDVAPDDTAPPTASDTAPGIVDATPSDALVTRHSLSVLADGDVELVRAVSDSSGLLSTLIARAGSAADLFETFAAIPLSRQIVRGDGHVAALSWTLEPIDTGGARLELRQIVGFVNDLCLVVDASTGGGMPADVLVITRTDWRDHLRDTLASGAVSPASQPVARTLARPSLPPSADARALLAALPDDLLGVLGPQWRPLMWRGTRWKGVLRLIGREPGRSERVRALTFTALRHLDAVVSASPTRYHARHARARRRAWLRRLKPAMALLGILAVMPLSWLFVAKGGAQMHPLALGLTPLMMVGVLLLSAREIPVLEVPPLPRPLAADRWRARAES